MAATNTHATIEGLLGVVVFVRFVPRLYNEGQLPKEGLVARFDEVIIRAIDEAFL
jgi:hypothetical protein